MAEGETVAVRDESSVGQDFTKAELIDLQYVAPEASLQPYLTTLYIVTSSERDLRDVLPAGVGYLQLFLQGTGSLVFADGRRDGPHDNALITPSTAAAVASIQGPCVIVGAALSPLGWAALTGLPADRHCDRAYAAADWLGPAVDAFGADLRRRFERNELSVEAAAGELAGFIASRLGKVNSRHARLIGLVAEWLSSSFDPPLAALLAQAPYSERQLQRLVQRYFGVGPKQLVRKYRALRVAAMLQAPDTSDETIAGLINLFYDQSHLIREIRHFLGRTPMRLGAGETPLLAAATSLRNYRDVKPNVARIPKG